MRIIYTAGPISGKTPWDEEQNIRKAEYIALDIWKTGKAAVLCPHTNTRFFQYAIPYETLMEGDFEIISRCDALLFIEGWEDSPGAVREERYALKLGIPVFYDIEDLKVWLDSPIIGREKKT
jgi:hypothetical protein